MHRGKCYFGQRIWYFCRKLEPIKGCWTIKSIDSTPVRVYAFAGESSVANDTHIVSGIQIVGGRLTMMLFWYNVFIYASNPLIFMWI